MRIHAYALKNVDETLKRKQAAWDYQNVAGVDRHGNPLYPTFNDFFDYKAALKKVTDPNKDIEHKEFDELRERARRIQSYREGKEEKQING